MKLYSLTDKGKRRELNEDYIYTSATSIGILPNLLVVADGMGGHNAGDYASKHTVEKVVEVIESLIDEKDIVKVINTAIEKANEYIYKCSLEDESLRGMGTTLVVATVIGNELTVANVGDSRLYIVNEEMNQITKDHSLVEEMISLGGIAPDEARNHPDKNIITRAIGVKPDVNVDIFTTNVGEGDTLLLCSDGLTNMIEDKDIQSIVLEYGVKEATEKLIEKANENGGRDNIAVILAKPLEGVND